MSIIYAVRIAIYHHLTCNRTQFARSDLQMLSALFYITSHTHTGMHFNGIQNSFNNFDIQQNFNLDNAGRNIETSNNVTFNFSY